jgi:hypothetical protein
MRDRVMWQGNRTKARQSGLRRGNGVHKGMSPLSSAFGEGSVEEGGGIGEDGMNALELFFTRGGALGEEEMVLMSLVS